MTWVTDHLTTPERLAYEAQLAAGYKTRTLVQLLDIDEKQPFTLTQNVIDGEVQVSTTADVSRSCTLDLEDVAGKLTWGQRDGADYAIYPGRMIRVHHSIYVTSLARWVDVPVFTGPITSFSRNGGVVSLEAQGKEWLMHAPFVQWKTMSWKKGANVLRMMRQVLDSRGEQNTAFPKSINARIKREITLPRPEATWPFLKVLARYAGNRELYYRGDGQLTLRPKATDGWAWVWGDSDILSEPTFSYDLGRMFNTVNIEYEQKTKKRKHTQYIGTGNPLSPENLKRNGQPLVMAVFYTADSVNGPAEATALGKKLLIEGTEVPVTLSFATSPVPFLEEGARVAAEIDGFRYTFYLREFSFSLAPGGDMTINVASDQLRKKPTPYGRLTP